MLALHFSHFGNVEVIKYTEVPKPSLNRHGVLIRTKLNG